MTATPPRRLHVLGTGGTIAARAAAPGAALRPELGPGDLLAGRPIPPGTIVNARALMAVDSAALTPATMTEIAAACAAEVAAGADAVVVLHGTDTLTESALVADLHPGLHTSAPPVVFTGAQRGADHPDADGPANLDFALRVAADPAAAPGVVIAFAGRVLPVWGTVKAHTTDLAGFAPIGPAGSRPHRDLAAARTRARSELGDAPRPAAPRVDQVALYPGVDGALIAAAVAAGACGLVLIALGAGNANPAVVAAVQAAVAAGVAVVVCTSVPGGRTHPGYGAGGGGADLVAAGAVFSPWLRAGQARILLGELLAAGCDRPRIAAVFTGDPV